MADHSHNRRRFLRSVGATTGLAAMPALTTAQSSTETDATPTIVVDTITVDDTQYTASIAQDSQTGETHGFILPSTIEEGGAHSLAVTESDESPLLGIDQDVLSEVSIPTTEDDDAVTTFEREGALWEELVATTDASVSVQGGVVDTADESLLERALENISSELKDSIQRIGAYYIESPKGTTCDASANSKPHHQLGVSIDYTDTLDSLGKSAIGAAMGAIAGYIVSGGLASGVLAVVGAVAGDLVDDMTDATAATLIIRDIDKCFFACAPATRVYASGIFMDEDRDLLRINGVEDLPATHLENGLVKPDSGYREVISVS